MHKTANTNDEWARGKYIRSSNLPQIRREAIFFALESAPAAIDELETTENEPNGIRTHVSSLKGRCPGPG